MRFCFQAYRPEYDAIHFLKKMGNGKDYTDEVAMIKAIPEASLERHKDVLIIDQIARAFDFVTQSTDQAHPYFKLLFEEKEDVTILDGVIGAIFADDLQLSDIRSLYEAGQDAYRLRWLFHAVQELAPDGEKPCTDYASYHAYVMKYVTDNDMKFRLVYTYFQYEAILDYAIEIVEKTTAHLLESLRQEGLQADDGVLEARLDGDMESFFREQCNTRLDDKSYSIYPSAIMFNSVFISGSIAAAQTHTVVLSHLVVDLLEISEEEKADMLDYLPDVLKALADKTKYEIIKILKKEKLYGAQLAERLNLTTATISYHVQTLQQLKILLYEKIENRLYYSLNEEKLKAICDDLQSVLL